MKKILLFAIVALAVTACKSPDQQAAEACLKRHLKCPSTLKVVEFEVRRCDADTTRDTTYHVARINGKKYKKFEKLCYLAEIKHVQIDSVCERVMIEPAHKSCRIVYDAQNKMGAMVRESTNIIISLNGETMLWRNWFERNYFNAKSTIWAESIKLGKPSGKSYDYIQCGDWIESKRWSSE